MQQKSLGYNNCVMSGSRCLHLWCGVGGAGTILTLFPHYVDIRFFHLRALILSGYQFTPFHILSILLGFQYKVHGHAMVNH